MKPFKLLLVIDEKAFNQITKDDQLIVHRVMGHTIKKIDKKNREDNFAVLNALQKQGIILVKPNCEDIEDWHKKASEAVEKPQNYRI
jgi:TRAP-type C4-dicarboxylate transport system substrate-binding protein